MTASESEPNRRNHNPETVTSSEPEPPLPPDGGWGWMVVLASLMCNIIVDGVCFSFGVMYVEFLEYFGESTYKTAFVGSLLPGMYLGAGEFTWHVRHVATCVTSLSVYVETRTNIVLDDRRFPDMYLCSGQFISLCTLFKSAIYTSLAATKRHNRTHDVIKSDFVLFRPHCVGVGEQVRL